MPRRGTPRRSDGATRLEALSNLYAWYREWAEAARATIRRRDHLIRLGLANRRSPENPDDGEGEMLADPPADS